MSLCICLLLIFLERGFIDCASGSQGEAFVALMCCFEARDSPTSLCCSRSASSLGCVARLAARDAFHVGLAGASAGFASWITSLFTDAQSEPRLRAEQAADDVPYKVLRRRLHLPCEPYARVCRVSSELSVLGFVSLFLFVFETFGFLDKMFDAMHLAFNKQVHVWVPSNLMHLNAWYCMVLRSAAWYCAVLHGTCLHRSSRFCTLRSFCPCFCTSCS